MLLYRCAKALLCALAAFIGILFICGNRQPACVAAAFMLIPVCLLLFWLQKRLWLRMNQRQPIICVEATLVNRRQVYEGTRNSHCKTSFLTFETEDGAQLEFEVSREDFDRIQIGVKGPLEYRGRLYVSFRRVNNK